MMNFKNYLNKQDYIFENISGNNKNGDCYIVSYQYIQSNPDVKLVHGLVHGQGALQGIIYNHAWIEDGNKIIDLTLPRKYQKSLSVKEYYELGKIDKVFKYDFKDMLSNSMEQGTYGPWEKILQKNKY
ncbi:MAG: hypothetical protein J7L15_02450 [Clostridiales bacterium]|nr:hypothetical protein [Clostridiales bacterium]